jgi:hypothetical protein
LESAARDVSSVASIDTTGSELPEGVEEGRVFLEEKEVTVGGRVKGGAKGP